MALCRLRFTNYLQDCLRYKAVSSLLFVHSGLGKMSLWFPSVLALDSEVSLSELMVLSLPQLCLHGESMNQKSFLCSCHYLCHEYAWTFCFLLAVSLNVWADSVDGSSPIQVSFCPLANETGNLGISCYTFLGSYPVPLTKFCNQWVIAKGIRADTQAYKEPHNVEHFCKIAL